MRQLLAAIAATLVPLGMAAAAPHNTSRIMDAAWAVTIPVMEYWHEKSQWPTAADLGYDPNESSPEGSRIELQDEGAILITFLDIGNKRVLLKPVADGEALAWTCKNLDGLADLYLGPRCLKNRAP